MKDKLDRNNFIVALIIGSCCWPLVQVCHVWISHLFKRNKRPTTNVVDNNNNNEKPCWSSTYSNEFVNWCFIEIRTRKIKTTTIQTQHKQTQLNYRREQLFIYDGDSGGCFKCNRIKQMYNKFSYRIICGGGSPSTCVSCNSDAIWIILFGNSWLIWPQCWCCWWLQSHFVG